MRVLERAAAGGGDAPALLAAATEASDAFSHAMGHVIALRQLEEGGSMPSKRLAAFGGSLQARLAAVQAALHAQLSAAIQARLAAAGWPPPLSAAAGEGGGDGGAAAGGGGWPGWAAAPSGEVLVEELRQLFVALLTLQRSVQHEHFAALAAAPVGAAEGPVLWPAEELAAPLAPRLAHHFGQGLPTDRADKPEWLFATALRAARALAPHAAPFQAALEAHGLGAWASLALEAARGVHSAAVAPLLRGHVLPRLADAADLPLWLHYADQAMAYERALAPLRGAAAALPGEEEDFLAAAHEGSALELLFERPEWEAGWLGAEHWDAARQLETACDAYDAWQPAGLGLPETPRGGAPAAAAGPAAAHEFWPPAAAELVALLLGGLVRRGGWLAMRAHRLAYMRAVPLAMLRAFRERLASLLQTGEQFRYGGKGRGEGPGPSGRGAKLTASSRCLARAAPALAPPPSRPPNQPPPMPGPGTCWERRGCPSWAPPSAPRTT